MHGHQNRKDDQMTYKFLKFLPVITIAVSLIISWTAQSIATDNNEKKIAANSKKIEQSSQAIQNIEKSIVRVETIQQGIQESQKETNSTLKEILRAIGDNRRIQ